MSVTHLNSNPVSSIATTDYILACDASGTLRCVSLGNLFRPAQGDGRNYLLQSVGSAQNCTVADGVVSLAGADADTFFFITPATDLAPLIGQWVTFSFECSGVLPGKAWEFSVENDNSAKCTLRNGRNVISFIGSSGNLIDSRGFLIDDLARNVSPNIKLWNFKLEQGLVATDWTPAPEDLRVGGVIGYYTITCTPREKGGRHERGSEGAERFDSSFGCLDSFGYGNSSFKRRVFGLGKSSGSVCFNVSPKSGKQSNHNLGFRKLHSRRMDDILKKTYGLVGSSTFLLCSQRYLSPTRDNIGYTSARGLYGENYPKGNTRQFITKRCYDCGETDCHNDRGRASNLGYSVILITNRKEAVAA